MSYGRGFEGAAYRATQSLDVTEIAKRMRVNLRNAQELGGLPAEMTFTVRTRKFAGGCAVDVHLSGMPDSWTYKAPGAPADYVHDVPHFGGLTGAARAAVKLADEMLQAYNRDDSDSMTDHFDVHFYGHATLGDEGDQWFQAQEKAVRDAQAAACAARKAAGLPTKGRDAAWESGRVAAQARRDYVAANPRPYSA